MIHTHATFRGYLACFILSIALTLALYLIAAHHLFTGIFLPLSLYLIGAFQVALQLVLFIGIYREPTPRWNLITLLFMGMIAVIVIFLSLWIMYNLNYTLMSMPMQGAP